MCELSIIALVTIKTIYLNKLSLEKLSAQVESTQRAVVVLIAQQQDNLIR